MNPPRAAVLGDGRVAWHPPCCTLVGQGIGKATHVTRNQDGPDQGSPYLRQDVRVRRPAAAERVAIHAVDARPGGL
jgi:hypothetical protein